MASVGFDSASSVAFFDRIASGMRLEAPLTTTPKPIVTLVFGLLHAVTGDWRVLEWVAILEFGFVVIAGAWLAYRTQGRVAAGFAVVGLLGTRLLLLDVVLTYASPWAVLGWLMAALLLIGSRPRYGLAGLALFLSTLARFETVVPILAAFVWLALWELRAKTTSRGRMPGPPRRAWLVPGIAALAVPVMMAHDLLLTGDPFFWLTVSQLAGGPISTPIDVAGSFLRHYASMWPLVALSIVGVADLVVSRRYVRLVGLLAVGPGTLAMLEAIAWRGTYISYRYTIPADVALLLMASFGVASAVHLVTELVRKTANGRSRGFSLLSRSLQASAWARVRTPAAVTFGGLLAVAMVQPYGLLDAGTTGSMEAYRNTNANFEAALPTLRQGLQLVSRSAAVSSANWSHLPPADVFVPPLVWPLASVDLGLPLWDVYPGSPTGRDLQRSTLSRPALVYFDRPAATAYPDRFRALEVSETVKIGKLTIRPLLASIDRGIWVVLVSPIGS